MQNIELKTLEGFTSLQIAPQRKVYLIVVFLLEFVLFFFVIGGLWKRAGGYA